MSENKIKVNIKFCEKYSHEILRKIIIMVNTPSQRKAPEITTRLAYVDM